MLWIRIEWYIGWIPSNYNNKCCHIEYEEWEVSLLYIESYFEACKYIDIGFQII